MASHTHRWWVIIEDAVWIIDILPDYIYCGYTSSSWCSSCFSTIQSHRQDYQERRIWVLGTEYGYISPTPGSYIVRHGKTITISATPKDGYQFSHFILAIPGVGDKAYFQNPLTIQVEGDDWCIETWFKPVPCEEVIVDVYTERGGRGQNCISDTWAPQDLVKSYAFVGEESNPYENWPVRFDLLMPNGTTYTSYTALTDENGIASWQFYLPWYCENPERMFGTWSISATAQFPSGEKSDYCSFRYNYLVKTKKVATISRLGNPGEIFGLQYDRIDIKVELECAMINQPLPVFLAAITYDDFGVPLWCSVQNFQVVHGTTTIVIPGTVYNATGIYRVHVLVYNKDPRQGGFSYYPEVCSEFQIIHIDLQAINTLDGSGNTKTVFGPHEKVYLFLNVQLNACQAVTLDFLPVIISEFGRDDYWKVISITFTPGENVLVIPMTQFNVTGLHYIYLTLADSVYAKKGAALFWYWEDGGTFAELFGDVNFDHEVDVRDISRVARAFGSYASPPHPKWDPRADVTGPTPFVPDGFVDMRDITLVARDYGKDYAA
ncbi:MAG: hypothetical protein KIH10_15995 [Candidatus Freyarchaeota archaeon]|nr:hypothetical protein [Candidatus Jordarchaeia archaeon]